MTTSDIHDDLRNAIFAYYAEKVKRERREGPPVGCSEYARRESALSEIQHNLDLPNLDQPFLPEVGARLRSDLSELVCFPYLPSFSAIHLELLWMLVAFWCELVVAEDAEINAPKPDGMWITPPARALKPRARC